MRKKIEKFLLITLLLISPWLANACPKLIAQCLNQSNLTIGRLSYQSDYHIAFPECKGRLGGEQLYRMCKIRYPKATAVAYVTGVDFFPGLKGQYAQTSHWIGGFYYQLYIPISDVNTNRPPPISDLK